MIDWNTLARAPNMARTASAAACRLRNQIEQRKAHDQEDDYPLDPLHVGLFILPVFPADYSNTLPHVQARACMFFFLPDTSKDWEQARRQRSRRRPNRFRSCGLKTDDHTFRRRVRIELTTAHRLGKIFQPGLAIQPKLRAHFGECDALDLSPGPRDPAGSGASGLYL